MAIIGSWWRIWRISKASYWWSLHWWSEWGNSCRVLQSIYVEFFNHATLWCHDAFYSNEKEKIIFVEESSACLLVGGMTFQDHVIWMREGGRSFHILWFIIFHILWFIIFHVIMLKNHGRENRYNKYVIGIL